MAIAINNEPRDCGTKRDGWYLTGGPVSKDGRLLPLIWVLGDMVWESPANQNLFWDVPPRATHYIDGEQSIDTLSLIEHRVGVLNRHSGGYSGSGQRQLELLRHTGTDPLCLLRHTGQQFYTPATKAIELVQQGPSERMDGDVVIALAPYLRIAPIKLFYSSSIVPTPVTVAARDRMLDYVFAEQPDPDHLALQVIWCMSYEESETHFTPSFREDDWRWTMIRTPEGLAFPNNGSQHWWVKLLSYTHRHPDIALEGVKFTESVFAGTHLTQALRVVSYETAQKETGRETIQAQELDDEQFASTKAIRAGVKVAILPPKGVDAW